MKKITSLLALVVVVAIFASGCASAIPSGIFYTEVSLPSAVGGGNINSAKVGTAKATSYFALIATGDASIKAAAANGGITNIKYVDYSVKNVLGFIGEYTTTVYGD
jgi:hypothetical protein